MEFDRSISAGKAEYLTPEQVSQMLQIPVSTLAVWRSTGRVKLAYVKVGRAVRYPRSGIDTLLTDSMRGRP